MNLGQAQRIGNALLAKRKRNGRAVRQLLFCQPFMQVENKPRQALLRVSPAKIDEARLTGLPARETYIDEGPDKGGVILRDFLEIADVEGAVLDRRHALYGGADLIAHDEFAARDIAGQQNGKHLAAPVGRQGHAKGPAAPQNDDALGRLAGPVDVLARPD